LQNGTPTATSADDSSAASKADNTRLQMLDKLAEQAAKLTAKAIGDFRLLMYTPEMIAYAATLCAFKELPDDRDVDHLVEYWARVSLSSALAQAPTALSLGFAGRCMSGSCPELDKCCEALRNATNPDSVSAAEAAAASSASSMADATVAAIASSAQPSPRKQQQPQRHCGISPTNAQGKVAKVAARFGEPLPRPIRYWQSDSEEVPAGVQSPVPRRRIVPVACAFTAINHSGILEQFLLNQLETVAAIVTKLENRLGDASDADESSGAGAEHIRLTTAHSVLESGTQRSLALVSKFKGNERNVFLKLQELGHDLSSYGSISKLVPSPPNIISNVLVGNALCLLGKAGDTGHAHSSFQMHTQFASTDTDADELRCDERAVQLLDVLETYQVPEMGGDSLVEGGLLQADGGDGGGGGNKRLAAVEPADKPKRRRPEVCAPRRAPLMPAGAAS
jgi:hypothetical protein